jgi:flagellar basal body-associated protein FliL
MHRMKIIIVVALVLVLAALASAGVFMLRKDDGADPAARDKRMARALALRVALSVALFLFILLAWQQGWIQPKGIPTGR